MRTAVRTTIAGIVVLAVALVGGVSRAALEADPPTKLQFACAQKSNGLLRAATSASQCDPKKETLVTFSSASPTTLCLKPDGSVRLGPCSGPGTTVTVPSNTPSYFCADMSSKAKTLTWVAAPSSCPPGTTAFVVGGNAAPTDIALSNSSIAENQPAGTTVGTLSATDPDAGDTHTFTLVSGTGDADNASFQIVGSSLKTNAVFDYETKSSYSVRVRATDSGGSTYEEAFTITVTNVAENAAPTDIQLSNSSVAENQPGGTNVGTLTTTDPDAGDSHTYSLVSGAGSDDNAKFQISGSSLQTAAPLDFEADNSLSVRIRTSDGGSGYEEAFTITVTNANDAPSDLALSNSSVAENQPSGTTVGTLSATDQDAGASHTFTLVAGSGDADNTKFQISGTTLQTAQSLDADADNSLSVRVRADDGAGGTFEKSLTITVTNANEAPTDIALSNSSVAENAPAGTAVGTLSATDPDSGDTHTFTLVSGTGDADNASFQIDGSALETAAVFDFETKSSYSVRVRATDGGSATFEKQLTISVTNVNEAPTDINLSNSSVAENQAAGTAVGTLSTVDDPGSTHTYSLVSGTGDADNASFQIDGSSLETNAVFDFETKSSYSVRIKTDDGGGGTFEKQFTVTITNANDAPSDIALSNASVNENEAAGTAVGTLSATDQDASDTHSYSLVSGTGATDNASFQITGTSLKTNAAFNYEVKNSYSIRVRVTDSGSATYEEIFTISVVDVNDAPVAVADSYGNAVGNTRAVLATTGTGPHIVLTGNVITNNDTDEDTTFPHTVSAVAETVASTGGGSATIAADGSFTFLPGVGDKNQVDTFTYKVTDGSLQSSGTVSVTIANVLVWYVNASAGAGDGRSSSPLNTLAGINGAGGSGDSDGAGDIVFLYSGTYGGGLPLEANQKLTGQPHGLTVNPGSGDVTLVAAGGTNPVIGNSGGAGIGLANGVEVQRVNVNGTSGAGVTGASVTNATIGGSTSIGGATGNAFELSGSASGTVDVGSMISSSTARSISVQNRSGGAVNFTGNVTDTGQGVFLNSNTGATVNLTGALTISTGTNPGFTATGGGTVNANTATNTIATTTGTALNVQNTTIGSSGLVFRSIAANGAANGIILNNTGNTAGLTVTGNGAAGTGGTITNITGADAATNGCAALGSPPAGVGIYLSSTRSPSFSWMSFPGTFANFGILGYNVNGFTLANTTMTGTYGGNVNVDEDTVHFCTLTGSASITNSTISNGAESNLRVVNASGTLNRLTLQNNTIGLNQLGGGGGTLFEAQGGTFNATVEDTTFQGSRGSPFQAVPQAGATMDLDFGTPGHGNTVHNTHGNIVSFAQNLNVAAGGTLTFDINSNHFDTAPAVQAQGGVFINAANSTANASGYFRNNTIGISGVANSGSSGNDPALDVESNGGGDLTIVVDNNRMYQWGSNGAGFLLQVGATSGNPTSVNATVTNNTIAEPGTFAVANTAQGFQLNNGTNTGENHTTCLRFANNVVDQAGTGAGGDVRLRQRFDTKVQMPGYTGAADGTSGSPTVPTYIQGLNPTGPPTVTSISTTAGGGGFFNTLGGAACAVPAF